MVKYVHSVTTLRMRLNEAIHDWWEHGKPPGNARLTTYNKLYFGVKVTETHFVTPVWLS